MRRNTNGDEARRPANVITTLRKKNCKQNGLRRRTKERTEIEARRRTMPTMNGDLRQQWNENASKASYNNSKRSCVLTNLRYKFKETFFFARPCYLRFNVVWHKYLTFERLVARHCPQLGFPWCPCQHGEPFGARFAIRLNGNKKTLNTKGKDKQRAQTNSQLLKLYKTSKMKPRVPRVAKCESTHV